METNKQDAAAIEQVLVDYYFNGIYQGDVNVLGAVFNKGTLLFGDEYLDGVANRQSPKDSGQPFRWTILSIDVVNSIAIAKVHVKMYAFNYYEFLSFHNIEGKWLIVNKMISDVAE
jgi:hypothetical protein